MQCIATGSLFFDMMVIDDCNCRLNKRFNDFRFALLNNHDEKAS